MNQEVSITRIWSDIDMIELLFTAENDDIKSQVKFYTTEHEIKKIKKKLCEWFPKNQKQKLNIKFGKLGDSRMSYLNLEFFTYDKVRHVAIEIEMSNNLNVPNAIYSKFYIKTDIPSINRFGKDFSELLESDGALIKMII